MPLSSMTGFSRCEGEHANASWAWEMKSVNGKGLDVRCRLPGGFERFEPIVRARAQKQLKRGNVSVNLTLNTRNADGGLKINWDMLDHFLTAVPVVLKKCPDAVPPSVDGLLNLRGVIEAVDEDGGDEERAALDEKLTATLHTALEGLASARTAEGAHLHRFLAEQVATIQALHGQAIQVTAKQTETLRRRLRKGVQDLLEESPGLPEDRLAQEVAVLFTKADISEELDRLAAHCSAAFALLSHDGSVGRKFDFLCQEFNREANTLCSKAIMPELTTIGLELKVVIDQMREQVQNVE